MIASASDFGDGEESRPSLPATAFNLGKENTPMIAMPVESWNKVAEAMVLIAEVIKRLGPKEEMKEELHQRMLTPKEAAKELHLHPQTVMDWCREGRITATKLGGKWLIPRGEVDRLLHRYEVINGKKKGGA
jgi:excisionase family DNA binding protein